MLAVFKKVGDYKVKDFLSGQGNKENNVRSIEKYRNHYEVDLSQDIFFGLCFIEIEATKCITTSGRKLKNVASLTLKRLDVVAGTPNWDFNKIFQTTTECMKNNPNFDISPIVLLDNDSAKKHGCTFYIQDGNHRCLGYAMYLLKNKDAKYVPIKAFLASNNER